MVRSLRLLCWNVNGIRAAYRKDLGSLLRQDGADVICLQETKATPDQLPEELREVPGYHSYFVSPEEKKGYSGVCIYTKEEPEKVISGSARGASIPRGGPWWPITRTSSSSTSTSRMERPPRNGCGTRWSSTRSSWRWPGDRGERKARHSVRGREHRSSGDRSGTAEGNAKVSGFLPQERKWIDDLLAAGFVDTFRMFDQSPERYTWWDMKTRARERNVGWRIDYFFVDEGLRPKCRGAFIMPEVQGSDHCPIGLELGP